VELFQSEDFLAMHIHADLGLIDIEPGDQPQAVFLEALVTHQRPPQTADADDESILHVVPA
jgi:hypothetical protein